MVSKHGHSDVCWKSSEILFIVLDITQFNFKDLKDPNLALSSLLVFYFKVCDARQDEQVKHEHTRVQGVASDLHAADERS